VNVTALQDEAGVLQDVYNRHQRGIASAKYQLSVVSTLLVGWAVVITVAVVVLLVVAFTHLRQGRLFDVASWSSDAEVGLPQSAELESDMEPDDVPVDVTMSRLATMCHAHKQQQQQRQSLTGSAVISEDELNTRDIPQFVHTATNTSST